MQQILITIPRDSSKGNKIEVNGVKGEGCKALTAALEQALGQTTADEPTAEMYENPIEQTQQLGG